MPNTLTHDDIRLFLVDDPDTNLVLGDYEYTPEQITKAMSMTVDLWNETPPDVCVYTVETFPWKHHLMLQVVSYLLAMASHGYTRNDLSYNIAGGSVDDKNKAPQYLQLSADYAGRFREWMARKKAQINSELAWGFA